MISTSDALALLFDLVAAQPVEMVPLRDAAGRILATTVTATRDQPPFAASSMDGYAVRQAEVAVGATFTVISEAAAGHPFTGTVQPQQAVRIFTGAPVPAGLDRVIIQEVVTREGDTITLGDNVDQSPYIRPAGADFPAGAEMAAPRHLSASDIALLAAMNIGSVPVARKPTVAIIATGDELVQPGETPDDAQIIASNSFGLAALLEQYGAIVRMLPIARDNAPALGLAFSLAQDADLIITIGGASVGDHDLVGQAALDHGMDRAFYKIAMRPGKPLMAGKLGQSAMIGLPGNPVSAMVCGHIFVLPVLRKMIGLTAQPAPRMKTPLLNAIPQNGPREHYMRARIDHDGVYVFDRQDSALLSVLADANCLVVRPPNDGPRLPDDILDVIML